jgi:hypothetical protein
MRPSLALAGALVSFLTLSVSAGPARAEMAPLSQPIGQAAPTGGRPDLRPHRTGLLIGGLLTFGVSYTVTAMVGLASLSHESGTLCNLNTGTCGSTGDEQGRDLLLPVLGPWMAMNNVREIPVLALMGIAQATGVALTVAGIARYSADGAPAEASGEAGPRRARSQPREFISFGVLPTRDGAFGFLSGRM